MSTQTSQDYDDSRVQGKVMGKSARDTQKKGKYLSSSVPSCSCLYFPLV